MTTNDPHETTPGPDTTDPDTTDPDTADAGMEHPATEHPAPPAAVEVVTGRRRAASPLAITSVVLGALGTAMALGVVWYFLALPFGLAAAVCAVVDRSRTKEATGAPVGGVTTVGLVLGLACIPLSLGALLIIPRIEQLTQDSAAALQTDVQLDLEGVERTATDNVNQLDKTLRELVASDNDAWSKDFDKLDKSTSAALATTEEDLKAIIDELEKSLRAELDRVEAAARADVQTADARAASVENELRAELVRINSDIAALRAAVTALGG